MEYRRLGRAGVKVSTVSLGSWLTYGGSVEEDTATACTDRAYEPGVNFFDTANAHARARSADVVRAARRRLPRDADGLATTG